MKAIERERFRRIVFYIMLLLIAFRSNFKQDDVGSFDLTQRLVVDESSKTFGSNMAESSLVTDGFYDFH